MKCSLLNCHEQGTYSCTLCKPEQILCDQHNREHIKFFKHPTFELKILAEIEMEEKNLEEQTNKSIALIYRISKKMIRLIETNTNRTIQNLISMNKLVKNPLDLNVILLNENDIKDIFQGINNLFKTITKRQYQELIIEKNKKLADNQIAGNFKAALNTVAKNQSYLEDLEENIKLICYNVIDTQNLISPKTHKLTYYNKKEERNRAIGKPVSSGVVNCDFCRSSIISSMWSCACCNFDLCIKCSVEQINSKILNEFPIKKCPNSHSLFYYSSNDSFYQRKTGSIYTACNYCRISWRGESWSCRLCSFNLCSQCIKRI